MSDYLKKNKWYQRNIKLIILIIYSIAFIGVSIFIIYKGLDIIKQKDINYVNNSNIDYKVYLKENDYYNTDYLDEDEIYITSLINKISATYEYNLSSDEEISGSYSYRFVADLKITEQGKDDVLFEKEEDLSNEQVINFENQKYLSISNDIDINYDYYNEIVSNFKTDYGVLIDAYVDIYLEVKVTLADNKENYTISNTPTLRIPLNEKTIQITKDTVSNDVNTKTITYTKNIKLNYVLLALGSLFIVIYFAIGVYVFVRLIIVIKHRNKYYVVLSKIFGNYDSIIVNSNKVPDVSDIDVLDVSSFEEVVDAQNEIHKPIIFNEVKRGKEAIFILMDDTHAYRYIVKAKDLVK